MFEIIFYQDGKGRSSILDYMDELKAGGSKNSRVKLDKILYCIRLLEEHGRGLNMPHARYLDGEIWELRPSSDRILFASFIGNQFILLHCFEKKTQKTPRREIEKAKRELAEMRERMGTHGG